MKLIIDIPEEQFITLNAKTQKEVISVIDHKLLISAIQNGTPVTTDVNEKLTTESPQEKWIPVSERLPEERGMYLVTEKEFAIGDRNHSGKFKVKTEQVEFHDGKWNRAKFYEVIAWQPLPEPYKKGGAE